MELIVVAAAAALTALRVAPDAGMLREHGCTGAIRTEP